MAFIWDADQMFGERRPPNPSALPWPEVIPPRDIWPRLGTKSQNHPEHSSEPLTKTYTNIQGATIFSADFPRNKSDRRLRP